MKDIRDDGFDSVKPLRLIVDIDDTYSHSVDGYVLYAVTSIAYKTEDGVCIDAEDFDIDTYRAWAAFQNKIKDRLG